MAAHGVQRIDTGVAFYLSVNPHRGGAGLKRGRETFAHRDRPKTGHGE